MTINALERVASINDDVCNEEPSVKQDCTDVINICLFFDGTGNNKEADELRKKWANPARLWRNANNLVLDDLKKDIFVNYAIYVSGVGTKFNGELNIFQKPIAWVQDTDATGGATGVGGTRRLKYGEEQFNDALKVALVSAVEKSEKEVLRDVKLKKESSFSEVNQKLLQHNLIKKINISAIGFSRGAALARAFMNDFIWKCQTEGDTLKYGGYPIEFKFLGLFDTVASFGLPATNLNNNLSFDGRDLVIDERIKKCVQLVAGNEQRFAFPLDLIGKQEQENGQNRVEIVYPGMHSDVGGGYTPAETEDQVSDNFARIPLKKMLDEALGAGVRMYGYDELKEKHTDVFKEQFEIKEETQRLFDAVQNEMQPQGLVKDQVIHTMKLFYSAYGSLDREGVKTANQKERASMGSWADRMIPWGPANMATEMKRLKAMQDTTGSHQKGIKGFFRVFSPVSKLYEYYLSVDGWEAESWEKEASPEVKEFYHKFVHDSKYGFLANAEPFSYFRQRTLYESRRSRKGREIDQQLEKQKVESLEKPQVKQEDLMNAYEQALNEENSLVA